MKAYSKTKAFISFVLVVMILAAGFPATAFAAPPEETLVRVGYMDYAGFIDHHEDGTYSGYGVDYLNKISEYTGYRYEYVFGQWTELLDKLANGEIDFLCTAQYTPDRAEQYEYSAYPIGYTHGLLYTKPDSNLCYEDYSSFDGLRVGAIRSSAMNELFIKYAQRNGFSCNFKEYGNETELLDALESGKLDAICSEHLANLQNLSLIASFGADAYYIISYQGNPYMEDINFALSEIKADPDFESELYHTYYDSSSAESTVQFTTEQRDYINNAGMLTVGIMQNRSPITYCDEKGEPAGMVVDLMNIVAEKSGLHFQYRFLDIGQTGYDFLTNSGGDIVAGVGASAFAAVNPNLLQSDPLQTASVVFVGRKGTNFTANASLTVAIPAGFINGEKVVSAQYPSFGYYNGGSNTDCLNAIRDGKADVMLQNMYVIRECLQSPLYDDLAIFPAYAFPEKEIVVALPGNELLVSIINKAVHTITDEQANDVVISNTIAKSYHANLGEFAYKYRMPLIAITVLLLAVIGILLANMTIRRRSYLAVTAVNRKLENTNAQLEDAVAQADRASTAKSQFLSRMSHEIRTPMNAIVGLTTIAKQHEDDAEKVDGYLSKIETSSKVLLNIINDVLDMSAIESGKLKIANEEFDIKQVLTGISTIYYPQCESKGIRFAMSTDLENESFRGDSLRVNQVLLNLVSNAYKFTESGGTIRVSVKEMSRKESTAFLRFTVSDTGTGMSEDMRQRLFKPFEQETAGTAQKHGGSGLGLSIAKNLVDMMHGAISVKSEKGVGTEFTVDLPFEIVGNACNMNTDLLSAIRILVVDDDPTSLDYASIVLRRIGAPFETAHSGQQALDMVGKAEDIGAPYDVVMLDWKMPDMDGVEVTRRIRASEKKRTMVIVVSAYDLNQIEDEAKAAGADHFVSKPLFQSTIFNVLMTLSHGQLHTESAMTMKYDFTGRRVLLAEDDALNTEIAVELLKMVNLPADHAGNGERAVAMFREAAPGTYDAILMDIQMPLMNGYEAARAIRALSRPDAKTVPIFAMTANAFTDDVSQALSAGMNGHIAKPIDTAVLYRTLRVAFQNED